MAHPILIRLPTAEIRRWFTRRTRKEKALFLLEGLLSHPMVKRGDWDRRTFPVEEHPAYVLLQRFRAVDFDEEHCEQALAEYYAARGKSDDELESDLERKLPKYVAKYRRLAESLQRDGYVAGLDDDEVGVAVDRDGNFVKVTGGNHRFALASLLGVPTVVAEVRFVHSEWYRHIRRPLGGTIPQQVGVALTRFRVGV